MTKKILFLMTLIAWLSHAAGAQKAPDQRRLLRIESRIYGWYGVAEPAFDQTIGRRELFKINAGERFLKGLDGRLVILQGTFSKGQLDLGELAPPPVSVPEGSRRQRFSLEPTKTTSGQLLTRDGYRLRSDDPALVSGQNLSVDLVVRPLAGNELQVMGVLSVTESEALEPEPLSAPIPAGGTLLELEMTQAFLDGAVDLGRDRAGLKVGFQGLSLQVSQLRVLLPDGATAPESPWRLEGTVELGTTATGSLAESSFVISARPAIDNNILYLRPNWEEIKLEGQLPFGFVLDAGLLGQLEGFLPQQLPIWNLEWVSAYLRSQGLLLSEETAVWFLGIASPGTLCLGLGQQGAQMSPRLGPLIPGNFRLKLAAPLADRLVRRGVQTFLNPEQPFVPDPPIPVGKVLFVAIKVEQVFLRSLQSGYSQGVFRFQDLVVDVAWRAGPLSGVEPLLSATGFVRPRLSPPGPDGVRYWDWDTKIESLTIRSDKLPGDKKELEAELIPRLEKELGSALASKHKLPARLPLSGLMANAASEASIEITELRPLDAFLELEGRLKP
jgi:hypothetical protein